MIVAVVFVIQTIAKKNEEIRGFKGLLFTAFFLWLCPISANWFWNFELIRHCDSHCFRWSIFFATISLASWCFVHGLRELLSWLDSHNIVCRHKQSKTNKKGVVENIINRGYAQISVKSSNFCFYRHWNLKVSKFDFVKYFRHSKWIYEISYIWTVKKDVKTWLIMAVIYTT